MSKFEKVMAGLFAGGILCYGCHRLWGLLEQGWDLIVLFAKSDFTFRNLGYLLLGLLAGAVPVAIIGVICYVLILVIASLRDKKND